MHSIEEITIAGIQEAFDSGELTSWDLTAAYMERIADIDTSGPALNSVLELNPDALYIAEAMDRERKLKCPRGPLHGVPILIMEPQPPTGCGPGTSPIRLRRSGADTTIST